MNDAGRCVVIWEFEIRPQMQAAFLRMYGREGTWAQLFARDEAYRGTELARDGSNPVRFVTIDRWRSRRDYEQFLAEHKQDYEALDLAGEAIMAGERKIGEFETVG